MTDRTPVPHEGLMLARGWYQPFKKGQKRRVRIKGEKLERPEEEKDKRN